LPGKKLAIKKFCSLPLPALKYNATGTGRAKVSNFANRFKTQRVRRSVLGGGKKYSVAGSRFLVVGSQCWAGGNKLAR